MIMKVIRNFGKILDILNQKKNIVETVGENYIQYQRFNTLPTYFTLSFTYKLNKMGDMKAKGKGAFMQEMIENGQVMEGRVTGKMVITRVISV